MTTTTQSRAARTGSAPLLRFGANLGGGERLGTLSEQLADIERVVTFVADLNVLHQLSKFATPVVLHNLGSFATPLMRGNFGRLSLLLDDPELGLRVDNRAATLGAWWLTVGEGDEARLTQPPQTIKLRYENPLEVVVAVAVTLTSGIAWFVNQIQKARRTESEIRLARAQEEKTAAETDLVRIEQLMNVQELSRTLTLTESAISDLLPDMPRDTIRAILASAHGSRAVRALNRLPAAMEVEVLEGTPDD